MSAGVLLRRVANVAAGDLLERVRRPPFVITLAFMIVAAWVFLPPPDAPYRTLDLDGHRIFYDSTGIGGLLAVLANAFLTFAGFYVVRGGVERDRRSGVGAVLAATTLPTPAYLYAKFASNLTVLAAMLGVLGVAGIAMQLVAGEYTALDPLALFAPIVAVALPAMALVSALAVAFDCVPGLRGGFGNVVFFVLWIAMLAGPAGQEAQRAPDPFGVAWVTRSMVEDGRAQHPEANLSVDRMSIGINVLRPEDRGRAYGRVRWAGLRWTPETVASRLGWAAVALGIVAVGAVPFDRFARERGVTLGRRRRTLAAEDGAADSSDAAPAAPTLRVATLPAPVPGGTLVPLVIAEWALLTRGTPAAWRLVALGLVVAGAFVPAGMARSAVLAAAWIWPIFRWSELGMREGRYGTRALMLATPRPVLRPVAAAWLAGVALALAAAGGVAARLALTGSWVELAALVTGAAFVPAFALAAGGWTGGSKLFEVLYLLLWYVGPLNRVPFLDYTGSAPGAASAAPGFAAAAAALLALAALARRRGASG